MSDFSDSPLSINDFTRERRDVSLKQLGEYDDLSSWAEWAPGELADMDADELRRTLNAFRGSAWAARAANWTPQNVPPIVIVQLTGGTTAIADGRGRTSYAIGMGWKSLPAIFLTQR